MTQRRYFQPVAGHCGHQERLLLRDEHGQWFLWMGDEDEPLAIEPALGAWIARRPELFPLPCPLMWFAVDDLPVAGARLNSL